MKPCNQCGKCCLKYGGGFLGSINKADYMLLKKGAPHAARYAANMGGGFWDIWIHPVTGEEPKRCPWLRKIPGKTSFRCTIYEYRPSVCREYPLDIEQMVWDECEMLEPADIPTHSASSS